MSHQNLFSFMDSIQASVVFVDNDHIIRYLNGKAEGRYYLEKGYTDLVGKSLFDCHNKESRRQIFKLYEQLEQGEDSISWEDPGQGERYTLVAVRDEERRLVGYYESVELINENE